MALFAVEMVRTVVLEGSGNIEIEGTLLIAAVDWVSQLAAVVMVVVTWLSSPPPQ